MLGRLRSLARRASPATVIALIALVIALGSSAYAAIPSSDGNINACYNKKTGTLRVIDPSQGQSCTSAENSLSWKDGITGKVADSDKLDGLDATAFARKIASGVVSFTSQSVGQACVGASVAAPGALETDSVLVTLVSPPTPFDVTGHVMLDEVTLQPLVEIEACNPTGSEQTLPSFSARYIVLR